MAADMPVKAPMLMKAPVSSWTGCYLGGGGGYGLWNQEHDFSIDDGFDVGPTSISGGHGWFGTLSGGCDYQVTSNWVIGAFADGDLGSLKGSMLEEEVLADEKMTSAWYVGARIGYLITPQLLAYWGGGYTQARFSFSTIISSGPGLGIQDQTYNGWFLSGGVEYSLPIFSGLFWRNDYRVATYSSQNLTLTEGGVAIPTFEDTIVSKQLVQTVRSELIFRFGMH
jgi:outer membrane immunogenic protein